MKEKIYKYGPKTIVESMERVNMRLDQFFKKPNLFFLKSILAHKEKLIDQMSAQELENQQEQKEILQGICNYYGNPDFSLLDKEALTNLGKKYLNHSDIQVKILTNTLLWNLIYSVLRKNRKNNNYYIVQFLSLIRNKKTLTMIENEEKYENIQIELENDSYEINTLKKILQPFIEDGELPTITNLLLEINHDKDTEKLEKIIDQVVKKWVEKNPIPDDKKDFYSITSWAEDDEYRNKSKEITNLLRKK